MTEDNQSQYDETGRQLDFSLNAGLPTYLVAVGDALDQIIQEGYENIEPNTPEMALNKELANLRQSVRLLADKFQEAGF
jgi:hypothetical protein